MLFGGKISLVSESPIASNGLGCSYPGLNLRMRIEANPRTIMSLINCSSDFGDDCFGTEGNDIMNGGNELNRMFGLGGNDKMTGGSGSDPSMVTRVMIL
jgi:Ca2+-binding RTX toxin-like protein